FFKNLKSTETNYPISQNLNRQLPKNLQGGLSTLFKFSSKWIPIFPQTVASVVGAKNSLPP
ncbi:MAG: hypothetical protein LBU34_16540, partial [Planctomycetaceae bacterium]|nr:hypothetical protein [Planctomycetaceae bacterium]